MWLSELYHDKVCMFPYQYGRRPSDFHLFGPHGPCSAEERPAGDPQEPVAWSDFWILGGPIFWLLSCPAIDKKPGILSWISDHWWNMTRLDSGSLQICWFLMLLGIFELGIEFVERVLTLVLMIKTKVRRQDRRCCLCRWRHRSHSPSRRLLTNISGKILCSWKLCLQVLECMSSYCLSRHGDMVQTKMRQFGFLCESRNGARGHKIQSRTQIRPGILSNDIWHWSTSTPCPVFVDRVLFFRSTYLLEPVRGRSSPSSCLCARYLSYLCSNRTYLEAELDVPARVSRARAVRPVRISS